MLHDAGDLGLEFAKSKEDPQHSTVFESQHWPAAPKSDEEFDEESDEESDAESKPDGAESKPDGYYVEDIGDNDQIDRDAEDIPLTLEEQQVEEDLESNKKNIERKEIEKQYRKKAKIEMDAAMKAANETKTAAEANETKTAAKLVSLRGKLDAGGLDASEEARLTKEIEAAENKAKEYSKRAQMAAVKAQRVEEEQGYTLEDKDSFDKTVTKDQSDQPVTMANITTSNEANGLKIYGCKVSLPPPCAFVL